MITQMIGVRDLLTRFKEISEKVYKGSHFIVIKNSKPIMQLTPYYDSEESLNKIKPRNDEHRTIIEAHRQYLRGETYTQDEIDEMIEKDTL